MELSHPDVGIVDEPARLTLYKLYPPSPSLAYNDQPLGKARPLYCKYGSEPKLGVKDQSKLEIFVYGPEVTPS